MNDQKLENLLNLALDATSEELERSERLSEGYDRVDNTWDLIIKYNGDLTELEREGAVFTPLVNEYAIVTIRLVVDTVTRKRIDRVHIYLPPKKEEDETEENYL